MEQLIKQAEDNLLNVYSRTPIVLEKGEGVYLYDTNGKKYLDFGGGIAVCAIGYGNEYYKNQLKKQIDTLLHASNLFYTKPLGEAAEKLCKASGLEGVFFTNSGAEAVEGAIKLARKYAYQKGNKEKYEIVAMNHSFHGRTMGAVSVTGTKKYREPFEPLIGGVCFAEYNDIDSVKEKITEKTCAIILEIVQGEGGILPAKKEFIKEIRNICDEKDIVLICDEIQCGMGRTGSMFAYQQYGILPDVVTFAKGIGGGVPVGAFGASKKVADALEPGDHGSTYAMNPLATTAVNAMFDVFEQENILGNVNEISSYLVEQLNALAKKKESLVECRGLGLMQGLVFSCPVKPIIEKALKKGLIVIAAGATVIRLVPPLVIKKTEVDQLISILEDIIE